MPACMLLAGGPSRGSAGSVDGVQEGDVRGTCCTRDAVGTVCRISFRGRRRLDGLSLALAKAPAFIGIAQPPKRMPGTRPAPVESAPAAATVAPTVAAPVPLLRLNTRLAVPRCP